MEGQSSHFECLQVFAEGEQDRRHLPRASLLALTIYGFTAMPEKRVVERS